MQTIQKFPTWFSKQKLGGKLAVGCSSLFIFFCLCVFSVAVLGPSPSNVEAASTPVDVSSIQTIAFETAVAGVYQTTTANSPTMTPFPTITPTPNIPTVTLSPIPTLTAQATATPDVYIISMSEKVPAYVDAYLEVVAYQQQVTDDTSLILDTDWKIKQGFALGTLELRGDEMAEVQPTPKYVALHSIITELAAETHLFSSAYAEGIDNLDADSLYQAVEHLQKMTTLLDQATAELEKLSANS
jgi:hypothetical protein